MPMDPVQAARDTTVPQIHGTTQDLTLQRQLVWAAVKAAGGTVQITAADLAAYVDGTSKLNAVVAADGAMTLTAT